MSLVEKGLIVAALLVKGKRTRPALEDLLRGRDQTDGSKPRVLPPLSRRERRKGQPR
jgi:hypothetical protein